MHKIRIWIYSVVSALPFIGALYYVLFPPQCPPDYTQQQVDASRCIIGANIGGWPLFFIGVPIIVFFAHWIVKRVVDKK